MCNFWLESSGPPGHDRHHKVVATLTKRFAVVGGRVRAVVETLSSHSTSKKDWRDKDDG